MQKIKPDYFYFQMDAHYLWMDT